MTDEELKELVAETSRQVRELRGSQQETERILRTAFDDLARSKERSKKDLDETFRYLAESQKRTDKLLGELGNRFGGFTEGMALPSIREILYNRLGVDAVVTDVRARRNVGDP